MRVLGSAARTLELLQSSGARRSALTPAASADRCCCCCLRHRSRCQEMGPSHVVVSMSLQTLGHILRMRQQLPAALEAAQRCETLRAASSTHAQGPAMAAALYLQVRARTRALRAPACALIAAAASCAVQAAQMHAACGLQAPAWRMQGRPAQGATLPHARQTRPRSISRIPSRVQQTGPDLPRHGRPGRGAGQGPGSTDHPPKSAQQRTPRPGTQPGRCGAPLAWAAAPAAALLQRGAGGSPISAAAASSC